MGKIDLFLALLFATCAQCSFVCFETNIFTYLMNTFPLLYSLRLSHVLAAHQMKIELLTRLVQISLSAFGCQLLILIYIR